MANKNNQNNSIIGIIITIALIIIVAICGGESELSKIFTTQANYSNSSEVVENLENVTITTGNDCITTIPNDGNLRVYCLDVGQGDSILISNNEKTMLIDASTNEMGNTVVKYLQDLGISKIDYLVGTHPHEDHIGGLDNVIKNFEIGSIYMPNVPATTKTYEDVLKAVASKKLKITTPNVGDIFYVGDAKCEVMAVGDNKKEFNECSIVIKMDFNGVSYLFTGDADDVVESSRSWPEIDILKVGHHGSRTSTTTEFLNQIKPKIALISVGKDNKYGHPTEDALSRLTNIGSKIYRTDEDETILITEQKE